MEVDWELTKGLTRLAATMAKTASRIPAEKVLDEAYKALAATVEEELSLLTGADIVKGFRGDSPKFSWRSIIPEKAATTTGDSARLHALLGALRDGVQGRKQAAMGLDVIKEEAMHSEGYARAVGEIANHVEILKAAKADADRYTRQSDGAGEGGSTGAGTKVSALLGEALRHCTEEVGATHCDFWCWTERVEETDGVLEAELETAEKVEGVEGFKGWKNWLMENIDRGAKNAHLYTKLPQEWQASEVAEGKGVISAAPSALLQGQRDRFQKLWRGAPEQVRLDWPSREAMERPSADEIRDAAASFKAGTAGSFDGIHVRHIALLSTEGLDAMADLMMACEFLGTLPRQIGMTPIVLLEKPKGGLRPIGLNSGFYRVWVRVRRKHAAIWEQETRRPLSSAAAGSGAEDTIFKQSIRVEAGVNQGDEAVALLYDGEAFYERIPWDLLIRCASELGFPTALVRLAVATYACPRVITFHGMLARELRPTRGITPGCGWATTLVKVAYLQMLDVVASKLPRSLTLDVHIDDFLLCGIGKGAELAQDFKLGEYLVREALEGKLGGKISEDKIGLVGSNREVTEDVAAAIGIPCDKIVKAAPNLGVDFLA